MPTEARKDIAGTHIGQYRLIKKIGSGGMGTVYVGEHILLGRRAAIKVLQPLLSTQPEIVERFFREAKATSAITDPGVVQIFDFGYHVDGTAYIVMELLQGECFADRITTLGRLPAAEALRIVRQLAGALAAAHDKEIVHRDLKPENVFLVSDPESASGERVKLLDFGICKMAGDTTATQTGRMLGTPVYMSPEQCRGAREVDARSDIYSLGCLLFHALTGRVPFDLDGTGEIIVAHLQQRPPKVSEVAPELSDAVDEIVEHCLAKDPADRFQTMAAVQAAIDTVLPRLTPAPQRELPANIAVGEGFKSHNEVKPKAPKDPIPSRWFDSEKHTPWLTGEVAQVRTHKRSLVAILISGVVTAAVVAMIMQRGPSAEDEAQLAAVMSAFPTDKEPVPMPAALAPEPTQKPDMDQPAHEKAPEPEIVEKGPPQPEIETPEVDKPEVDKPVIDKPEAPKPTSPPTQTRRAKPVQRTAPVQRAQPQQPAPSKPSEDLYETR